MQTPFSRIARTHLSTSAHPFPLCTHKPTLPHLLKRDDSDRSIDLLHLTGIHAKSGYRIHQTVRRAHRQQRVSCSQRRGRAAPRPLRATPQLLRTVRAGPFWAKASCGACSNNPSPFATRQTRVVYSIELLIIYLQNLNLKKKI